MGATLMNTDDKEAREVAHGREIMRLVEVMRNNGPEGLLQAALDGRPATVESIQKLYGFALKNLSEPTRDRYWKVVEEFLRANTALTSIELDNMHDPRPRPGDP